MAVKTITIDVEAYDLLSRRKKKGESFSKALKRLLADEASTASGLLRDLPRAAVAPDTLDRIEDAIRDRELDWTDGRSPTGRGG
jgi:predicted CopG family antitoxin